MAMTLSWGGLAEAAASIPSGAVTDLSQVEVVAGSATGELRRLRGRGARTACRHTDGVWRSEDRSTHWYEPVVPAAATTAAAARPPTAVR